MYNFIRHITLNEGNTPKTLTQAVLHYKKDDLEPAISEETINYHYGKLYKTYVERFNNGEGDADFNEAGAFLHHLLFTQYQSPQSSNAPTNIAENFINKYFKSFDNFKDAFQKEAMKIQGSGCLLYTSPSPRD
jgi:Fe-Mn family superoxide dismutase